MRDRIDEAMTRDRKASWPLEQLHRTEMAWAVALLLLALALRIAFVLTQQKGFYFEDSLDYDRAARSLLETGHFNAKYYRFPLYPLFLAVSYGVFGTGLIPVRILQSVAGTATCALIWLVGRRLFGPRAGLLALAGAAVFPAHIVMSGIEYPVVLGTFLIWMVLWLHTRRERAGSWPAGALALATGVAALASTLFEGGLVIGAFLAAGLLFQQSSWRLRLRQIGIIAAVAVVALLPWLSIIARRGDYRPIFLKAAIHLPSAPGVDPPLWQGSGANLLKVKMAGLVDNPGWTMHHIWKEFWHFWNPYPDRLASADDAFREQLNRQDSRMVVDNRLVAETPRRLYAIGFAALLAAGACGAFLAWRAVPGARFLIGWPVFLGFCYAPFFTQMRYRIPADPAFILLAAYAVERCIPRGSGSRFGAPEAGLDPSPAPGDPGRALFRADCSARQKQIN